ncbi:LysM peptidoglycan-binding domain-containing M23 family metallopeptidase [Streptomyces chromofuscus]|uniref:Peptidoglycan DD-metalloendopeptidase family protein n=1 Tax=Streptomyces chromofuscus TaxID=42881 RepID=A0A7M2T8D6_STRCW|nr:LysM peptidoglycan-binding domain-containing M23 family metallopeptidase [Streptomyces chromofuscus]QOV44175.1 peptidoglycan DD-metalloendopeptidase family protein [Streptomyces chromofuscus]GGT32050.1 peptidase [Streptomyces chromofuscus]
MPAKGKHRRPKTQRFTRSIAVAGTGGAALALPLMGAAGAHAATPETAAEKAVQSAPAGKTAVQQNAAVKKSTAEKAGVRTYSVKVGDYLSKIADEQNVSGGWQRLYEDNREVVGEDPSLIHPGLKLTIGKKAAASSDESASSPLSSESSSSSESSASTEASQSSDVSESAGASEAAAQTTEVSTSTQTDDTAPAAGFSAPVDGVGVGTAYRVAGSMWSSGYHTGVDFAAPTGTPLKAVGAGTVVSAGWAGAYGNQVVIQLADGYYAQYAHLSSLSVSSGQSVTAGQQVGLSGSTGNSTGPHLHFEIRTTPDYGSDVDPIAYLRSKGVSVG